MNDTLRIEYGLLFYISSLGYGEVKDKLKVIALLKPEYFADEHTGEAFTYIANNPEASIRAIGHETKIVISEFTYAGASSPLNVDEALLDIKIIKECYLEQKFKEIADYDYPSMPIKERIALLESNMQALTKETDSPTGSMLDAMKDYERLKKDKERFDFGIAELDRYVQARRGGIYVVGGLPGSGKSFMALQFALMQALNNKKVLFFSTEFSVGMNFARFANLYTGIDDNADLETAKDIVSSLDNLKLYDTLTSSTDIIHEVHKQTLLDSVDIVVIDHLQEITSDKGEKPFERIEYILNELRELSMEKNICVLLASQLNKDGQFKGAGKTHEVATVSMVINRDPERPTYLGISITKNRFNERPKEDIVCLHSRPSGVIQATRRDQIVNEFESI